MLVHFVVVRVKVEVPANLRILGIVGDEGFDFGSDLVDGLVEGLLIGVVLVNVGDAKGGNNPGFHPVLVFDCNRSRHVGNGVTPIPHHVSDGFEVVEVGVVDK